MVTESFMGVESLTLPVTRKRKLQKYKSGFTCNFCGVQATRVNVRKLASPVLVKNSTRSRSLTHFLFHVFFQALQIKNLQNISIGTVRNLVRPSGPRLPNVVYFLLNYYSEYLVLFQNFAQKGVGEFPSQITYPG